MNKRIHTVSNPGGVKIDIYADSNWITMDQDGGDELDIIVVQLDGLAELISTLQEVQAYYRPAEGVSPQQLQFDI